MRIFVQTAAVLLTLIVARAQGPSSGGFVPGQQRPAGDPVQIERGRKLYSVSCRACHGADLRGGDIGGPNLLRSQLALSDRDGELIVPVIQGSLQNSGMPAINISVEDAKAVAAYVRSVLATIGVQGKPPSVGQAAPSVLIGDAKRGETYFQAKCSSCHSLSGDLRGIATKYPDPKILQNIWVAGGGRGRRGAGSADASTARAITVSVTPSSGATIEGHLARIDDFLVTLELPDGTARTIRRNGDEPKVELRDPLKGHRDLLAVYSDQDMHDVTAFLVTLK